MHSTPGLPARQRGEPLGAGFFTGTVILAILEGIAGSNNAPSPLLALLAMLTDVVEDQFDRFQKAFNDYLAQPLGTNQIKAHGELYLLLLPQHRALETLRKLSRHAPTAIAMPRNLKSALRQVREMRGHYEHVDERFMTPPNEELFTFQDQRLRAFGNQLDLALLPGWIDTLRSTLVSWAEATAAR